MSVQTTYPAGLTAALARMITRAGHRVQSRVAYALQPSRVLCACDEATLEASQIAATDEPLLTLTPSWQAEEQVLPLQTVSGATLNGDAWRRLIFSAAQRDVDLQFTRRLGHDHGRGDGRRTTAET